MLCKVYVFVSKKYASILNLRFHIGVRAGARTGYVIPGRDGIGGLDLARNSSAAAVAVAVVVAVRRRRWIGCAARWRRRGIGCAAGLAAPLDWLRRWIGGAAGLAAPLDCFRYTGVILHADRKSNGRDGKSNGRDGKSNGRGGKSNGRDM